MSTAIGVERLGERPASELAARSRDALDRALTHVAELSVAAMSAADNAKLAD